MAAADTNLWQELRQAYPWIDDLGLDARWFQDTASTVRSGAEFVATIRNTPQWKRRFAGIYDADGQMRMNEAEYVQTERAYRQVLRQYGVDVDGEYSTPSSLVGFFEAGMDANELRDRLQLWQHVKDAGRPVRDAFYVYAGMSVSDDDLFEALIDPARDQQLWNEYNARVAQSPFDYELWITRATEVGLQHVAESLQDMQRRGEVTSAVVQRILSVDPNFARSIMGAIYTGGATDPTNAAGLPLQELLQAFEFAAIGGAAVGAGLEMPTLERLSEIRAAGVDRAKAISSYQTFGRDQGVISAAVQRVRGRAFSQSDFEAATFLGDARQSRALMQGLAREEAAGRSAGTFRFDEVGGRLVQRGFTGF